MRSAPVLIPALWLLAAASVAGYAWLKLSDRTAAGPGEVEVVFEDANPAVPGGQLPRHFQAPAFALTDQHGQPFASDQLKGKAWIGFLFLTHCPTGACPVMVGKMAQLQEALPDERIHFVSFSVDPGRDTPEAMLAYAREVAGAEVSPRWHLLTGGTAESMQQFARDFKLIVDEDFGHSTVFLLVDAQGHVRGVYGNDDPDGMSRLRADAAKLLAE